MFGIIIFLLLLALIPGFLIFGGFLVGTALIVAHFLFWFLIVLILISLMKKLMGPKHPKR